MLKIRQGTAEDAPTLSEIAFRSKAHWGYDKQFMEDCRHELTFTEADFPVKYFGIAEDPITLGFYGLEIQTNCTVELIALFVEPQYIGNGYGKALLNHAKIQAKIFGADTMLVQSDPNAVPFYTANGGIEDGEIPSQSIPGRKLPRILFNL